ncbi:MAG: DUF4139 domain-containing protein [Melioribacteraceae bacterium]|nr:DUF4139 domain-containing protein [Melioribacteraceae bacterium]
MLNRYSILAVLVLFLGLITSTAGSDRKSVSVTVYNQNLGVIKDIRTFEIQKGLSTLSLAEVAEYIDPTSVHINFEGSVLEQNYRYDLVNMNKILNKYIDKTISLFNKEGDMLEGKLLSAFGSQIVLQKNDGGLTMIPDINDYRLTVGTLPEGLITKPTLVWTIESEKNGEQDVEVTYQTGGMNWHAEYVALLNEDDSGLDLNSWVSIDNNSGTTFKDAKLKLIAGDVNLVSDQRGVYINGLKREAAYTAQADEQFAEQEFFEYHIYTLQRPATLSNNETKQISLFEAGNVKAEKKFYYKSANYYGGTNKGKVSVILEFRNGKAEGLGVPMPKGKVRVYKSDGESIEFIGEDLIDHTPLKEDVKLKIGEAFDLVVEEKQTENNKISNRVYEKAWEITFKNRKKEDVVVNVDKHLGLGWTVLNSSFNFEKTDAQNISFKIPVKADDETILKFKIRFVY